MLSSLVLFLALVSGPLGCHAVTKVQIEAAIGQSLGEETNEHTEATCTSTFSSDDVAVTISIQHLAKPLDLAAEIKSLQAAFPGARISEVNGVAEHAFALEIPGAGTQLHLLPGEHDYLLVSVLGLNGSDHGFNAAVTIARALMSRQ